MILPVTLTKVRFLVAVFAAIWAQCSVSAEMRLPSFVGSGACADCHVRESESWKGSDHAWAWKAPDPESVLGDFSNTEFEHKGVRSRFFTENGTYRIETDNADGTRGVFDVVGTIGVKPLQQYILSSEPGRLQAFDVAWDTANSQWFQVFPDQEIAVNDALHWSGPYKSWEARCAECHSTGYSRTYDTRADTYQPVLAETGVGCESCHGPASDHLRWANGAGGASTGFSTDLSAGAETEIQQCAGCHSRRENFSDGSPLPGTPFHDSYNLALLRNGLYHADGTIQDEVYVYGSFLQSKMYARGVRCSDCHESHSGDLKAEGNAICTQCHSTAGNSEFPDLIKAEYDRPEHHKHQPGTPGASCAACHMSERTYMVTDNRSDHFFRIPRPDLAVSTGSPDTCTDCHTDQTAAWAADVIAGWYPDNRNRGPHFSTVISRARFEPQNMTGELASLAEDTGAAGIIRATALDMMLNVTNPDLARRVAPLMADDDPLIRAAAASLQRGLGADERLNALLPSLKDPVRLVRIAAAKAMVGARPDRANNEARTAFQTAMSEWRSTLSSRADFPETHMNIGGIGLSTRNMALAQQAFTKATQLDPQLIDAWIVLARIHVAEKDIPKARAVLNQALTINPGNEILQALRTDIDVQNRN